MLAGSAALALWVLARYSNFGPRTLIWAIIHVVAAMVLLQFVSVPLDAIKSSGLPATRFFCAFGVALPDAIAKSPEDGGVFNLPAVVVINTVKVVIMNGQTRI